MYQQGLSVPQDYAAALENYRQAAEQGAGPLVFINLGGLYEHGLGVTRDLVQAYAWYSIVERESRDARSAIERLKDQLTLIQISEAHKRAQEWLEQHPRQ